MKKYIIAIFLLLFFSNICNQVNAEFLSGSYKEVFQESNELIKPQEGSSIQEIQRIFYKNLIPIFKYIFIFIAILFWTLYTINIISSRGDTETISKQRNNILYGIIGFIIISLAIEIGEILSPVQNTDIVDIDRVNNKVVDIINYVKILIGTISIAVIFYTGFKIITNSDNPEEVSKTRVSFIAAITGMVIVMLVDPLVNNVFFPADKSFDEEEIKSLSIQIFGVMRFILTFLGILSVGAFIIAGFYYIISVDDEEKRKKSISIMLYTGLGIIITLSSYTMINTFIPS